MLAADPQRGNGRTLRRFTAAAAVVIACWWFGVFVASMQPTASRRIAIDLDGYFLPRYVVASERLAARSLGLWNAAEFAGVPLLGTGQAAVLYPPRAVLFAVLPPRPALHAFMVFHYVLLAVGTFVFLRAVGLEPPGAAFGAVIVTFQPFMMHGHYAPHWISNFAWAPWVLAAGVRAITRPSLAAALALATATSLQVLAGYPEYAFDTALLLGAVGVLYLPDARRAGGWPAVREAAGTLAAAAAGTALVTAVQWVPLLETALSSVRASGDFAFMFGLGFERGRFAPGLAGWVEALSLLFWAPPLGWALVVAGLAVSPVRHRVGLMVLGFVCFAIPTWLRGVPPFSFFRGPLCWLSLLHLPLAAVAGAGLDAVLARVHAGGRPARRELLVGLAVAAGAVAPLVPARALGWFALGAAGLVLASRARDAGAALVVASALGAAWTSVPGREVALPQRYATGTRSWLDVEAGKLQGWLPHRYAAGVPTYPDGVGVRARAESVRAACGDPDGRVLAPPETWLGGSLLAGVASPQGYPESLASRFTTALLAGAGLAPLDVLRIDRERLAGAGAVLQLLDVRCAVMPAEWEPLLTAAGYRRQGTLADGRVVAVRHGRGAFLPEALVRVATDDEALAAVLAPGFDPERQAIVVGGEGGNALGGAGAVEALDRPAPGEVRVRVAAPDGGYLVVPETWYPGWRARVDGVPAAVERADYALLGVRLAPGASEVQLWYEPRGFAAARLASLAGIGLLAAGGVVALKRRARTA